jgi:hypothetical protein
MKNVYIVWTGAVESDYTMTKEQAENAAQSWKDEGYTDVVVEEL